MESQPHHIEVVPRIQDSKLAAIYTPKKQKQSAKVEKVDSDDEYDEYFDDDQYEEEPVKQFTPLSNTLIPIVPQKPVTFTSRFFKTFNDYLWPVLFVIFVIVIIYIVYTYITKYRNKPSTEIKPQASNVFAQPSLQSHPQPNKLELSQIDINEAKKHIYDNDTMSDTASVGNKKDDSSDEEEDEEKDEEKDEEDDEEDDEENDEEDDEEEEDDEDDEDQIKLDAFKSKKEDDDMPLLESIEEDEDLKTSSDKLNLSKINQLVSENMDNIIEPDNDNTFDSTQDTKLPKKAKARKSRVSV